MLFLCLAISISKSRGGGDVNILSDSICTASLTSSMSSDFFFAYVE